jgi:predicted ArsR family transcriptional regulator
MQWVPDQWWYQWVPLDTIGDTIIAALQNNADEPMSVTELMEATDESRPRLRKALDKLADDGRIKMMPSQQTGNGSTGKRYRLPTGEASDSFGGLSVG